MQCCQALRGPSAAAACQPRLICVRVQSRGTLPCSTTRALAHLEQFTYRPQPSPLKAPSLRRGWILSHNHGTPDSALEILLARPEQEQESEREEDLSQGHQWRQTQEGEEYLVDGNEDFIEGNNGSVKSVNYGGRIDGLGEENENKNEEKPILTKPKYVRGPDIDKKSFIRIYYISALRVPAAECWDLVFELREHLLNWPRVNNVGRVPGDDVDEDLAANFVETSERKQRVTRDKVRAAVYADSETELSGKKLAVEANRKGNSKREIVSNREVPTQLELVEADDESEQEDNTPVGGVPYLNCSKKWAGPTRLLLLDEKYARKQISELPPALQAVYSRFEHLNSKRGLVTCRLTIFYEYWSMDEVLLELLPAGAHAPVKFDRAGHVAELRLHPEHLLFRHLIAQVTLDKCKPTVRSVVVKRDILDAKQYAVQLEILAGTTSLVTTAWEYAIPFRIDMAYMIWDPRLSSERQRLVNAFSKNDVVCDVCAGVGPVAIPASKKVRMVYANEVNSHAHHYLARNVVENKVSGQMEVFNEDIQTFLSKMLYIVRPLPITQLIMSHLLPAEEFLEFFQGAFCRSTWPNALLPRIHLYGISGDTDPAESFSKEIAGVLRTTDCKISTNLVVEIARGEWIVSASFILPADFGFSLHWIVYGELRTPLVQLLKTSISISWDGAILSFSESLPPRRIHFRGPIRFGGRPMPPASHHRHFHA